MSSDPRKKTISLISLLGGMLITMTDPSADVLPARKRPAHWPVTETHNRSVIVFLTVCTSGRAPWLPSSDVHAILRTAWEKATNWRVGRYVLLPDHLHLFCAPGCLPPESLARWVGYWKRISTISIRKSIPDFSWQRDHWDTQLRHGESYASKWKYVQSNPVRHKLANDPADWPYQGEIERLEWHD